MEQRGLWALSCSVCVCVCMFEGPLSFPPSTDCVATTILELALATAAGHAAGKDVRGPGEGCTPAIASPLKARLESLSHILHSTGGGQRGVTVTARSSAQTPSPTPHQLRDSSHPLPLCTSVSSSVKWE